MVDRRCRRPRPRAPRGQASRRASPAATAARPGTSGALGRHRPARRRVARHRAGAARARGAGAGPPLARAFQPGGAQPRSRRRAVQPALPGDPRGAGPRLLDRLRPQRLSTTPAPSRSRSARLPSNAHEVLDLLHAELDRLAAKGITDRELEVAKGHLRADLLLSLEDSGSRMSRIGAGAAAVRRGAQRRGAARPHRRGHRRRRSGPSPSRCSRARGPSPWSGRSTESDFSA